MIADLSRQRPFGRQSLIYLSSGPSQKMFVDPNTDNTNLKCFIPKGLFKLWMLFYIRLYKGVLTCLRVPSCSWGSWWQWSIQECTPAIKLYRTKYTHTHMSTNKTGEIWTRWLEGITINIPVVILYYNRRMSPLGKTVGSILAVSLLFLTTSCKATNISKNFNLKKEAF